MKAVAPDEFRLPPVTTHWSNDDFERAEELENEHYALQKRHDLIGAAMYLTIILAIGSAFAYFGTSRTTTVADTASPGRYMSPVR